MRKKALALAIGNQDGGSGAAGLFNSASFYAPLLSSAVVQTGIGGPTFSRASVATVVDHEGTIRQVISGETRFTGARRVYNRIAGNSQDLTNVSYSKVGAGTGSTPTVTANFATAPDNTQTASRVQLALNGGTTINDISYLTNSPTGASSMVFPRVAFYIKSNTAQNYVVFGRSSASTPITFTVTPTWQRFAPPIGSGAGEVLLGIRGASYGGAVNSDSADLLVWGVQCEETVDNSNNSPSEYVSVGVLSSPYHGAMVDGVKYFEYENGNTVTSNVVTEAQGLPITENRHQIGFLPGTSGSYFSTTDPTTRLTGDLDLRVYVAPEDWTPAALQLLLSKWDSGTPSLQFIWYLEATGALTYIWSTTGLVLNTIVTSTSSVSAANGQAKWLRVTHDVNNGAAGNDVKFWTSDDGITWTQLGTTVTTAGATTIADTNRPIWIGAHDSAAANTFNGSVIRALVYNGIDGQLVSSFNANDWGSGSTFVSSTTGETWTLNSGARITNFALKGYYAEPTGGNLVLYSSDLSNAAWIKNGTPTITSGTKRVGDVLLDTLDDQQVAAAVNVYQVVTFTGDDVKAWSLLVAQGTSTSSLLGIYDVTAAAYRAAGILTWVNGVPSMAMSNGTHSATDVLGNGVFRLRFVTTAITAANVHRFVIYPATDIIGTVTNVGSLYVGGMQAENNFYCSSLCPTTSTAATRPGELLSWAAPGIVNEAEGTLYGEFQNDHVIGASRVGFSISDNSGNESTRVFQIALDTTILGVVVDGGVTQAALTFGSVALNTKYKNAIRYTTNYVRGAQNGTLSSLDGTVTLPTGITVIHAGSLPSGGQFCGNVKHIRIWKSQLTESNLLTMTK